MQRRDLRKIGFDKRLFKFEMLITNAILSLLDINLDLVRTSIPATRFSTLLAATVFTSMVVSLVIRYTNYGATDNLLQQHQTVHQA